ncbi:hypothetical protein K439DRAFT_1658728 [Ramaria rubella]|nr:hypothetical protein K439DRAFT_1658728 [Ramaria rubella]
MSYFSPLFIVLILLHFCLTALGQQISLVTPSVVQCANVPITWVERNPSQWSGGVGPFSLTIATTDNANISSLLTPVKVEFTPVVHSSPSDWVADLPGGTPFTISVTDNDDNNAVTPTLFVQDSSNSSCLEEDDTVPPPQHGGHFSQTLSAGTSQSNTETPTSGSTATGIPTSINNSKSSSRHNQVHFAHLLLSNSSSHTAIIAGVVVGVIVLLAVITILMIIQRRKDRHQTSSKEEFVRTFGSANANLDGAGEDDMEEMAMPEPYVYRTVSHQQPTSLAPVNTEAVHRGPSATGIRPSPSPISSTDSPSARASRKGERYLPNDTTSPQDESTKGAYRARIEEEDIDRLAVRMVAMMAAGRLAENQAYNPGNRGPRNTGLDLDEELPAPPPMYNDVARRSGPHPRGGF